MRRLLPFVVVVTATSVLACKSGDDSSPANVVDSAVVVDSSTKIDSTLAEDADAIVDTGPKVPPVPVIATTISTRVETQRLMFASGEMQISGEPFARDFMGRNLDGYDRHFLPTDRYSPSTLGGDEIVDLVGFSTAIESYEYSKFHMNMIASETYAGPSLAWGPVVNAGHDASTDEPTVRKRLADRFAIFLRAASADLAGFAIVPPPASNPLNTLGFSGLHPILAPYRSFDPSIVPDNLVGSCTFTGGYAVFSKAERIPDYECGYASLKLGDRVKQIDFSIAPGAIGLATWKEALWGIDFLERIHDAKGNQTATVSPSDEPLVGKPGNTVVAKDDTGTPTEPGTYLGSVALEGMWGLTMMEEMDNAAAWLLSSLPTADGATLGGFSSVNEAISYDYSSSPRWWPASIKVVEGAPDAWPSPGTLTIDDAKSHAEDLAALLLGHAMLFGMTDQRNVKIGGTVGLRLTFDGDPFPKDDGAPNGEATVHDRALGVLRVAFVDLDRFHTFPGTTVVTDEASPIATGDSAHGNKASATSLAHVSIALRQALLSLNAAITQYGGADPSPKLDDNGLLNSIAIHPPGGDASFSARMRVVLTKQTEFVRDVLSKPDGTVANFATFGADGKPTLDPSPTTLESQTAAIRALLEGFLTTSDKTYVDRARACFSRLERDFWAPGARLYRGVAGGKDEVSMNAERFAFLQSALREVHKIAHVPGDAVLSRNALEPRIARVNKLFLNGWDDFDGDQTVTPATECLAGRLQMGEQALTGEFGRNDKGDLVGDRDNDCVLNISWGKQASLLAGEVLFSAKK